MEDVDGRTRKAHLPPAEMSAGRLLLSVALAGLAVLVSPPGSRAQSHPPPLSEEQAAEVRAAIEAMKREPRGPYLRIRWFCNDGTVQPPAGAPCRTRGSGVQHAEMGEAAKRLERLGFHVGTILTATPFDELFDAELVHDRLKQLVLQDYLIEVDDGWVLRRARYYRGARQAEDEEASGTAFLHRLLSDPAWVRENLWLAGRLVAALPHGGPTGQRWVQRTRGLSTEIAALEPDFMPIRVKIHSFPSRDDLRAVERFLGRGGLAPEVRTKLAQLRDALRRQYDRRTHLEGLADFEDRLSGADGIVQGLREVREGLEGGAPRPTLGRIADLASRLRGLVLRSSDGERNLLLMDLDLALQEQAMLLAAELEATSERRTRRARLSDLSDYFALAEAAGLLSERERRALDAAGEGLARAPALSALEYTRGLDYLSRSLEWATATVRSVMTPTFERYLQAEPEVGGFPDAAVRASILLPLSIALARLGSDADEMLGTSHVLLGESVGPGIRGLNPGAALGPLAITDPKRPAQLDRSSIYVLPETTPELRPVAGVLTLDAGNLLSHIQLLAQSFGIPNASIPSSALPVVERARGRTVFYAVSPLGRVIVKDTASLGEAERAILEELRGTRGGKEVIHTSDLRLDVARPIPLRDLRAEDSGVLVGPKAANLGQLAASFPEHVAEGVALPFGMFYRHVNRPIGSGRTVVEEMAEAGERARRLRADGRSEEEIDRFWLRRLERIRTAIVELEWLPEMRAQVEEAVRTTFGSGIAGGLFVRSDTNVEDLPEFSGAGLNLTVPNQRSVEDVLAAIKRVWASPFSERAYLWRSRIFDDPGQVYSSVLLLRSVPSEKSGVLISSGLQEGGPRDLTIATAEGVAGAVAGGEAETILVGPDGTVTLLSQAKDPERLVLAENGGLRSVPARRPEHLLAGHEIRELREVVRTWKTRLEGSAPEMVWDVEFAFAGGRLWLFQIRPFTGLPSGEILDLLSVLDRPAIRSGDRPVPLDERL